MAYRAVGLFKQLARRCTAMASLALLCALSTSAVAAVTYRIDGGQLMGASGVPIEGFAGTFSVNFVGGTCEATFGGCTTNKFTFNSFFAASAAADALSRYVFIDTPEHNFDSEPWLTNGCASHTFACLVITPYGTHSNSLGWTFVDGATFENFIWAHRDGVSNAGNYTDYNPDGPWQMTHALWSLDSPIAPVPEPGIAEMLGLGACVVLLALRRRHHGHTLAPACAGLQFAHHQYHLVSG